MNLKKLNNLIKEELEATPRNVAKAALRDIFFSRWSHSVPKDLWPAFEGQVSGYLQNPDLVRECFNEMIEDGWVLNLPDRYRWKPTFSPVNVEERKAIMENFNHAGAIANSILGAIEDRPGTEVIRIIKIVKSPITAQSSEGICADPSQWKDISQTNGTSPTALWQNIIDPRFFTKDPTFETWYCIDDEGENSPVTTALKEVSKTLMIRRVLKEEIRKIINESDLVKSFGRVSTKQDMAVKKFNRNKPKLQANIEMIHAVLPVLRFFAPKKAHDVQSCDELGQ